VAKPPGKSGRSGRLNPGGKKTVFVAGGLGFFGARIGQSLRQAGHQVLLGTRKTGNFPEGAGLAGVPVPMQWEDKTQLEDVLRGSDVVVHAAGPNAKACVADPVAAMEFCRAGTARLVEAARRAGVQRILYISTIHVYRAELSGDISEESPTENPHPYAQARLAGEREVAAGDGPENVILRFSNSFGPPVFPKADCWGLVIQDLCRQAVEQGRLTLRGPGGQQRDFIPMGESCRILGELVIRKLPPLGPRIYNVGSGFSLALASVAQQIQDLCQSCLGFRPVWNPQRRPVDDPPQPDLRYRTDRLAGLGLRVSPDIRAEIQDLLRFCQNHFGPATGAVGQET